VGRQIVIPMPEALSFAESRRQKAIYVDDILLSTPDKETAKRVLKETRKVLAAADLPLGKMFATSNDILEDIPEELKANTMKITDKENHSALGMKWNKEMDTITYDNLIIGDIKWTRRSMAAWTAAVYDPHGLIDPIMLEGKLAVQATYRLPKSVKIEWDTPLTPKLHPDVEKILKSWVKWKGELAKLLNIHIPRCLVKGTPISKQMLAYSDRSSLAYAATFYLRLVYADKIEMKLIGNKAKLAPLQQRSIPEMELLGAWLAALVGHKFARSLGLNDVHCFYDSLITLARVLKPGQKRGVFATNRITTIVDYTDGWKFGYVPTKENPADIPTRGATVETLINSDNWHNGPPWARMTEDNWPKYRVNITEEDLLGNKIDVVATAISQEGRTDFGSSLKEVDTEKVTALPTVESDIKHMFEDFLSEDEYKNTVTEEGDLICSPKAITTWQPHRNQTTAVILTTIRSKQLQQVYDIHKISTWPRAVRTYATMKIWSKNLGRGTEPRIRTPTRRWIWRATMDLIRLAQYEAFGFNMMHYASTGKWQKGSTLLNLNAYLDMDGILRSGSRAKNQSWAPEVTRRPIMLPRDNRVTLLIARRLHNLQGHGTSPDTLALKLQALYWIKGIRSLTTTVTRSCVECQTRQPNHGMPTRPKINIHPTILNSLNGLRRPVQSITLSKNNKVVLISVCLHAIKGLPS
jgi:hypothetical protein